MGVNSTILTMLPRSSDIADD